MSANTETSPRINLATITALNRSSPRSSTSARLRPDWLLEHLPEFAMLGPHHHMSDTSHNSEYQVDEGELLERFARDVLRVEPAGRDGAEAYGLVAAERDPADKSTEEELLAHFLAQHFPPSGTWIQP